MNSRRAEKTAAAERAENMIEKIKYWLFQKGKDCKRCCLRCRAVFITFRRAYKRTGNSNHALEANAGKRGKE